MHAVAHIGVILQDKIRTVGQMIEDGYSGKQLMKVMKSWTTTMSVVQKFMQVQYPCYAFVWSQ